ALSPWGTGGVCLNFLAGPDVTTDEPERTVSPKSRSKPPSCDAGAGKASGDSSAGVLDLRVSNPALGSTACAVGEPARSRAVGSRHHRTTCPTKPNWSAPHQRALR